MLGAASSAALPSQMPLPIAINGVGRIGRALFRRLVDHPELDLVALNDQTPGERLVPLLARDTFHGPFPGSVDFVDRHLLVADRRIRLFRRTDPAAIPWGETGARLVIEATGSLTDGRDAAAHLGDGVDHVVISANAPEADLTVCFGVNHELVRADEHRLISAASCTTNCLAVIAHVLDSELGIDHALLNTVHCYNNSQPLTDADHADPRRARAAAVNMVPTTTGASSAIGRVLPRLAGRLDGFAVRVPAAQVSMIDLVAQLAVETDAASIESIFRRAASGPMEPVLAVAYEPLVSTDFIGDTHSAVVDIALTQVVAGRMARVVAWYDNEMGYASRLADLAEWIGRRTGTIAST